MLPLSYQNGGIASYVFLQSISHVIKVCVRIHRVCLVRISMTCEPTGNMCALLLVGVAHTFGTVGHVQQIDSKP